MRIKAAAFARRAPELAGAVDPRIFQIAFLGILLAAGAWLRDFSLEAAQIVLTFAAALLAQRLTFPLRPDAPRSYLSAVITALSLTLLLRADNLWVHPAAACAAIASKPLIRIRGKICSIPPPSV
jgi:non-ribosomal peptide synthetase component F